MPDTETPDEEDLITNSIADPHEQAERKWQKYLRRLQAGTYGDEMVLTGVAELLGVSIRIVKRNSVTGGPHHCIFPHRPQGGVWCALNGMCVHMSFVLLTNNFPTPGPDTVTARHGHHRRHRTKRRLGGEGPPHGRQFHVLSCGQTTL